jgi:hypothetical protein
MPSLASTRQYDISGCARTYQKRELDNRADVLTLSIANGTPANELWRASKPVAMLIQTTNEQIQRSFGGGSTPAKLPAKVDLTERATTGENTSTASTGA